jgi:hypothetical protein
VGFWEFIFGGHKFTVPPVRRMVPLRPARLQVPLSSPACPSGGAQPDTLEA